MKGSYGRFFIKLVGSLTATMLASTAVAAPSGPATSSLGPANPALISFHQRFAEPELLAVGERVHMAFAYEYANLSFIEGDDGVIVVDAGFYPDATRRALADFRQVSSKPIKAIIYTHIHLDHTGGIDGLLEEQADMPVIYGPADWEHFVAESTSVLMPMVMWRAFAQNGVFLPKGEHGAVGAGIGPVPTMKGSARIVPPGVTITQRTHLEIAGVTLELIPTPGDIASSHMMVWMPDEQVLFGGDTLGGTFPYLETSRFELDRDPAGFVASLDLALSLQPEYVIAGHGRLLKGRDDVEDVLTVNRDVIQFMIDQVERWIAQGYSADQIIDVFELPKTLADHPDLQPHYHRVEWMIRGMYLKRAGFVGDVLDLSRHTDSEEARRLIPLIGGEAAAVKAAEQALLDDDPRWAARLASYVLLVNPGNETAVRLRMGAFRAIAASTDSSNERNRLLSEIVRESGYLDWQQIEQSATLHAYQQHDAAALIDLFRVRVKPELAEDKTLNIEINLEAEEKPYYWSLSNSVLRQVQSSRQVHGSLALSRQTLLDLFAGKTSWQEAIQTGLVTVGGNAAELVEIIQ